jgi:hypothetical protein
MRRLTTLLLLLPLLVRSQDDSLRFITTDVESFWKHYDLFWKDTTQNPFENYFAAGTRALNDFFKYDEFPAKMLKRAVRAEKNYYDAVRPYTKTMQQFKDAAAAHYQEFKKIYPAAQSPPVYFVIGVMNRGGTASEHGMAIGTERYADTTLVNSRGWGTTRTDLLPSVIAKCLVFYHQKPAHTGWTLLRESIVRGSVEFLTTLFVPGELQRIQEKEYFQFGERYEEMLVKEFLLRKNDNEMAGWMYGGKENGRPDDLGVWIGYKITEAYYQSVTDKQKAIDDILKINDFERFLLLSGYAEPFRN